MNNEQAPTKTTNPRLWAWVTGIIAAFLAGLGIGSIDDTTPAADVEPDTAVTVEEAADEPDEKPEPAPEPEPEFDEPTADDFVLSVRTLEKKCFGSAGCNVTFQIDAGWGLDLDPDKTYEVTYEITGGDDPLINTMKVTGEQYSVDSEERIGTPSSDSKLEAAVLSVREG